MKAGIILCIAYAFLTTTGCSQSNKIIKGYAYARNIISGVKPGVSIDENGTITSKQQRPGMQYFIYVETKDSTYLAVKKILIKGNEYFANAEVVKELPVTIAHNTFMPDRDTLVAANKFSVWKINVGEIISSPDTTFKKPSSLKENEVLISFLYKNKIQYFSIAKLQYLEPVRLE